MRNNRSSRYGVTFRDMGNNRVRKCTKVKLGNENGMIVKIFVGHRETMEELADGMEVLS